MYSKWKLWVYLLLSGCKILVLQSCSEHYKKIFVYICDYILKNKFLEVEKLGSRIFIV